MQLSSLATLLTVLSSIATYVDAGLSVTSPLGFKWKAGSKNIITWVENQNSDPIPDKLVITLVKGDSLTLQEVGKITTDVDTASGQYEWTIPATQEPGVDYAIRLGPPSAPYYSPHFEIVAADGTTGGDAGAEAEAESTSSNVSTVTSTSSTVVESNSTSEVATSPTTSVSSDAESTEAPSSTDESNISDPTQTPTSSDAGEISTVTQTPGETESPSSSPSSTPGSDDISDGSTNAISFAPALFVAGCVISQLI